jgi:hypothetical protein
MDNVLSRLSTTALLSGQMQNQDAISAVQIGVVFCIVYNFLFAFPNRTSGVGS